MPRNIAAPLSHSERAGAAAIADGVPEVLLRTREQLMQGASQIKLMAGGGVFSPFDPLDATQYGEEEMHAAVGAAEDWNTYATVHAYTPRAIQRAIAAGVKCIEHGQLADEATARLMAEKAEIRTALSWVVGVASPLHSLTADRRGDSRVAIPGQLGNNPDEAFGMKSVVKAERNRAVVYWLTTAILAIELLVGGAWDVLLLPQVREVIHRVGYPVYFLVILGVWKILGSIAIIVPRFPRLKEWAYAGVVFNLSGALASNLASGIHDAGTAVYLVGMMGITALSWALRPPPRRTFGVS